MPNINIDEEAAAAAELALLRFEADYPRGLITEERVRLRDAIAFELRRTLARMAARPIAVDEIESPALARIAAGDVVRLRSGGPLMTVGDAPKPMLVPGTGGPVAACFWHDDEQHAASGLFPAASLVPSRRGEPALVEAALELWGPVAILDGNDRDWAHPFDYYQSPAGARRIVRFGKALAGVDGKGRSFVPRREG